MGRPLLWFVVGDWQANLDIGMVLALKSVCKPSVRVLFFRSLRGQSTRKTCRPAGDAVLVGFGATINAASESLAHEQNSVSEGGVSRPGGCRVGALDRGLLMSRSVGIRVPFGLCFQMERPLLWVLLKIVGACCSLLVLPTGWSWATKPCSDPWCLWIGWLLAWAHVAEATAGGTLRKRWSLEGLWRWSGLSLSFLFSDVNAWLECCCVAETSLH